MKKRNMERMRYSSNSLAGGLCLLSIVGNVVFFISLYANPAVVPDYRIGLDIILNILFMLVAFLAGEEAKVYHLKWSFVIVALALVQFARIFWLPEHYNELGQLVGRAYQTTRLSLLASAVFMLAAGIVCYVSSAALRKYLKGQRA